MADRVIGTEMPPAHQPDVERHKASQQSATSFNKTVSRRFLTRRSEILCLQDVAGNNDIYIATYRWTLALILPYPSELDALQIEG